MITKNYSKTGRSCRVTFKHNPSEGTEKILLLGEFNEWGADSLNELKKRKNRWQAPESRYRRGFARLYQEHVSQANLGCDFDFLLGTPGETREPDIF